jgi:septum formation protein
MTRPRLVLGSASPRRRELLTLVGYQYDVIKPDIEEVPKPGESPVDYVRRNAKEKAKAVADKLAGSAPSIIISADTIVVLGGEILEKPRDADHAVEMLGRLSGREHTVVSGVTLMAVGAAAAVDEFTVETRVKIKRLSDAEVRSYVRTGEPLDKAGGYAAQGIGSYMVERIEGSYANVVGLPIAEVVERLASRFQYSLWS